MLIVYVLTSKSLVYSNIMLLCRESFAVFEFLLPILFLNPLEDFYSPQRWQLYKHHPHDSTVLYCLCAAYGSPQLSDVS